MPNIHSRTKIIATIGPASSSKEVLKEMILSGVNTCRLNFSHSKYEDHLKVINNIRELNHELNANIAILADLQGPKIRIGEVENNSVELVDGSIVMITSEKCLSTAEKLFITYENFSRDVETGDEILIDDGKLKLKVTGTNKKDKVFSVVIHGGILSSKKGVNLPNTKISLPCLTPKDIEDARFALEHDVDWIALSFVRSVTDIVEMKEFIKNHKKHASVIAKIEKPEAINEIDNIIDMSDGIMIARGDLGVEIPFDKVPILQKSIIEKCMMAGKPVIVATQMMESMITNFRPTRAEANDVANAVMDGADSLMLSGETSVGKFAVDTISSMQKIISSTENNGFKFFRNRPPVDFIPSFLADSICYNACVMAEQSGAKAIITFSWSGYTAFKISSYRPKAAIFVFSNNKILVNKLSLAWGIKTFFAKNIDNIDNSIERSINFLIQEGYIKHEDIVVHVGSTPLHEKGKTNMLKISYV
jgi:pyruvate kinase